MTAPRFRLISEADARALPFDSIVELEAGGMVTPLARETLAARRVTVVAAGASDPSLPPDLAPPADVRRVAIGSDHTGLALKASIIAALRQGGRAVTDHGTESADPVDYPDIAERVARAIARGEVDAGIVIDGAGLGSAIAANKIRGVRAAMCVNATLARYARQHNGANVLTLGLTLVDKADGLAIVETFLGTPMTRGAVHPPAAQDSADRGRTSVTDATVDLARLDRASSPRKCSRRRDGRRACAPAMPSRTIAVRPGCRASSMPERRGWGSVHLADRRPGSRH